MSDWTTLINRYQTFLVDLVGVVHDGLKPYPIAIDALNQLPANKELIFVSNTPRPGSLSYDKLKGYGLRRPFSILTSGDYARSKLEKDKNSLYYHWGGQRNVDLLQGISLHLTNEIEKADKVLLTAFLEEREDPHQFDGLMQILIKRQVPVYCINPDKVALHGQDIRRCAGYFAERFMQKGGYADIWGKPTLDFYHFVEQQYGPFHKQGCLMIGDTLETDISGAKQFGIDSLLVLSGISEMKRKQENLTLQQLTKTIHPTYISSQLGDALIERDNS